MARKEKIAELVAEHGSFFKKLIVTGKIPAKQLDNFFGRHTKRQRKILAAMKFGASYSKAYAQSEGEFDTKRWSKIPIRTAACRGLLLKTTAQLASSGDVKEWSIEELERANALTQQLASEAVSLIHRLCRVECRASEIGKRPSVPEACVFGNASLSIRKKAGNLSAAVTKMRKNIRDVPQMVDQLGELPTIDKIAKAVVEAARIVAGSSLMLRLLRGVPRVSHSCGNPKIDPWGVGLEYSPHLLTAFSPSEPEVRIATHKDPDADALVAVWMAQRYLFPEQPTTVEFVSRDYESDSCEYDCVVDVGRKHDPNLLRFDPKSPTFEHQERECATSLVWKHIRSSNTVVERLRELVELIHDGDAATNRSRSAAYKVSRVNGLHALIEHARASAQGDQMLYQAVGAFLDAKYS